MDDNRPVQWMVEDQPSDLSKASADRIIRYMDYVRNTSNVESLRKMWFDGFFYYDLQMCTLWKRVRVWGKEVKIPRFVFWESDIVGEIEGKRKAYFFENMQYVKRSAPVNDGIYGGTQTTILPDGTVLSWFHIFSSRYFGQLQYFSSGYGSGKSVDPYLFYPPMTRPNDFSYGEYHHDLSVDGLTTTYLCVFASGNKLFEIPNDLVYGYTSPVIDGVTKLEGYYVVHLRDAATYGVGKYVRGSVVNGIFTVENQLACVNINEGYPSLLWGGGTKGIYNDDSGGIYQIDISDTTVSKGAFLGLANEYDSPPHPGGNIGEERCIIKHFDFAKDGTLLSAEISKTRKYENVVDTNLVNGTIANGYYTSTYILTTSIEVSLNGVSKFSEENEFSSGYTNTYVDGIRTSHTETISGEEKKYQVSTLDLRTGGVSVLTRSVGYEEARSNTYYKKWSTEIFVSRDSGTYTKSFSFVNGSSYNGSTFGLPQNFTMSDSDFAPAGTYAAVPYQYGAVGDGADIMIVYLPRPDVGFNTGWIEPDNGLKKCQIWPSWEETPIPDVKDYCTIVAL